jgi:propanediol dehydratase large subunit
MPLTKPNQDLRRDLKQAAALLKWSGVDLLQAARKLAEAGQEEKAEELLRIAVSFQETEDRLAGYADEVKAGVITRAEVE